MSVTEFIHKFGAIMIKRQEWKQLIETDELGLARLEKVIVSGLLRGKVYGAPLPLLHGHTKRL
jgi:hypothetical protein